MRRRSIIRIAVVLLAAAAVAAGAWTQRHRWQPADPPPAADHHDHDPAEVQSVKLSDEAVRGLGLVSAAVKLEDYPTVVEVPGVVIDPPGASDRAVAAPAAGVVAKVHAVPGETVRAGDPLVTLRLTSELALTAQADLARAAADLVVATARRDQVRKLVAAGTSTAVDLTDAENRVRGLAGQARGARWQLRTLGLTAEQVDKAEAGDFVAEIVVPVPAATGPPLVPTPPGASDTAPLAYEVEALAVTPGQGVTGGQLLARLANHRTLLIEGRAFESEAPLVAAAARARTPVGVDLPEAAPGDWDAVGQAFVIHSVGNTLDPATRTFPFTVPLANQARAFDRDGKTHLSWRVRPGQKVRLRVPVGAVPGVVVLPAGAVVREGADAFVFRQNGDVYDRKAVAVVGEDRLRVAVAPGNGIGPGVYVLQNNAAAVNRALKAAQARGPGGAGGPKGHWHADGSFHEADE